MRAVNSGPAGTSNGTRAAVSVRLDRTMRWATVDSATRKARAISSVVRPPSSRRVSATRLPGEHRVAGDEDQAEQVVLDHLVQRGRPVGLLGLLRGEVAADLGGLALQPLGPPERVDGAVLGGGHEPGARLVRGARFRPSLERRDQGVLRELLGQADVAGHAGQGGDELRRLHPPDGVDHAMDGGHRPGRGTHQAPCWAAEVARRRSSCSRSSGVIASPKSSELKTCRTSISSLRKGAFLTHSKTSSREETSRIQKPAMSSLVSAKGPSTTVVWPSLSKRTRAPFELGCRPSPASMTPAFTSSSL